MKAFTDIYVSDTTAGMGVQTLFESDGAAHTARVYVRLTHGGDEYALLFAGTVDTTFADGTRTKAGDVCDPFALDAMRVGLCDGCGMDVAAEPRAWQTVSFDGAPSCTVHGDPVATDPIPLTASAGDTLCVEMTFRGNGRIPCHEEIQIPTFLGTTDGFVPTPLVPVPIMIGVRRTPSRRVAFLGDSITQGIGATPGTYRHWAALTAQAIGGDTAFWNLGIGFARSGDAAATGSWLARAAQNDIVVLCLGVNDILRGIPSATIAANIEAVIGHLQQEGCRVLLQSVPPFEFSAAQWTVWREVNDRIRGLGDAYVDHTAVLCDGDRPRYGGHPNDDGCAAWAQHLIPVLKRML